MWTRRAFCVSGVAAGLGSASLASAGNAPGGPKYLIFVIANGGWDVTYCMDPKVGAGSIDGPEADVDPENPNDSEDVRTFTNLPIICNDEKRPSVRRFFEAYGDQTAVINGIWTGSIVHQPSRIRMFTGTRSASNPDLATIIGADGADLLPLGSVDFSGLGYAGPLARTTGRIGATSQLKALLDPTISFPAPRWADYTLPLFEPNSKSKSAIEKHLQMRAAELQERFKGTTADLSHVSDYLESLERGAALVDQGQTLTDPLTLGVLPSPLEQADLAVDLLASGMCRTVTMAHLSSWDTHDLNILQHDRYEVFFEALKRLLDQLKERELLEQTVIVAVSEMTRTPRRNFKGGKDHWAHTSAMVMGAGVAGGRVYGGTDDSLLSLPVNLESGELDSAGVLNKYDNFAAGILNHFGIDSERWLPTIPPFSAPFL